MILASLIKKGTLRGLATATPATPATPATGGAHCGQTVAKVAGVAVANPQLPAANDLRTVTDIWNVYIPPGTSTETVAKFRAASVAVDAAQRAAGVPTSLGPDSHCWPRSSAMNGQEIDTFTARLIRFTHKGLDLDAGERLVDKLVIRDRENDDRRVCLECTHLYRTGGWRCGNWQDAGVAGRSRDSQLPADLTTQLQRCDGFTACPTSTPEGPDDDQVRF